jgi:hypothetical protein
MSLVSNVRELIFAAMTILRDGGGQMKAADLRAE